MSNKEGRRYLTLKGFCSIRLESLDNARIAIIPFGTRAPDLGGRNKALFREADINVNKCDGENGGKSGIEKAYCAK